MTPRVSTRCSRMTPRVSTRCCGSLQSAKDSLWKSTAPIGKGRQVRAGLTQYNDNHPSSAAVTDASTKLGDFSSG
jgi:hypothetical protein